jgi:predicted O-linked N-acetylglucosamine transferase (SPINDLY family)
MQISIDTPESMLASVAAPMENQSMQPSEYYEAAILVDETIATNYWYLGLSYLLAGREEDAQATWFVPLAAANELEADIYTNELLAVLECEASKRSQAADLEMEWSIRQQIWMLKPDSIENILYLIVVANELNLLTSELLIEWEVEHLLEVESSLIDTDNLLLEYTISALLNRIHTALSQKIIKHCLLAIGTPNEIIVSKVVYRAFQLFHQQNLGLFSLGVVEICQSLVPGDLRIYQVLSGLYSGVDLHTKAIAAAQQYADLAVTHYERLFSSYLVQRAYLTACNWHEYQDRVERHRELQNSLVAEFEKSSIRSQYHDFIISSYFAPYTEDNPQINRPLQNQISRIYQETLEPLIIKSEFEKVSLEKKINVLRIGYLASTLKEHSVGWLSRWLFHYHDRESFQIFNYCINQNPEDKFNHKWFRDKVDITYYFNNAQEAAAQIKLDEVDILIDLDSLTFDVSCLIMAYKPAPVQVTWLGWDAVGLPAIDYFIADNYVLPDDAQDYYQEKIWRMPQTYLAVDGFEVGIPTLTRRNLNIPDDAIVYFSSQGGYKRHPDNVRCQMRIIKSVPNSYFLIKGKSDPTMIQDFFGRIATEEGVSLDRLRFLDGVRDEATHRANLAIADIVLDTFPYNGATTTLETLWMGIPMVTRVGEQFASRNSYAFMLNAGIEEGIAWSEQEYVDWGIKLGLDRELRYKIQGKLRSGRSTAPVWNAKQFTLEMEQAYRQMWAKYQEQNQHQEIIDYSNN